MVLADHPTTLAMIGSGMRAAIIRETPLYLKVMIRSFPSADFGADETAINTEVPDCRFRLIRQIPAFLRGPRLSTYGAIGGYDNS